MKTTLNIPPELIDKAVQVSGVRTKTGAVILALQELIRKREVERILEQAGSLSFASDEEMERMRHER